MLGNNSSITSSGTGAFNVISASGVNMTNGTLTLNGDSTSSFVINISGNFTTSNSCIVLAGGVLPQNVVWNISGNLTITGGGCNNYYGTALDVNGAVTVHDKTWNGELIGGTITDTSGFTVNSPPPQPQPPHIFVGYADNDHAFLKPAIGKSSIGGSTDHGVFTGYKLVNSATAPFTGEISQLNVYTVPGVNTGTEALTPVVYANNGGVPGALLGTGPSVNYNNPSSGTGWLHLPLSSPVSVTGGTSYWIGFATSGTNEAVGLMYDSVAGSFAFNVGGATNPFGTASIGSEDISMFATMDFPSPWQGSPNVIFDGSSVNGHFDSGAIRIDAPASNSVTVSNASVVIGSCHYNPWPGLNTTIPAGESLILTQTGPGPVCLARNSVEAELSNFDTSESSRADGFGCSPADPAIPQITLTINGTTETIADSGRVLNRGGIDPDDCLSMEETAPWTQIQ
jgi:hypothetical protein